MKYPKLPKVFKTKWLRALRSGKYKQGDGSLKKITLIEVDENGKEYNGDEANYLGLKLKEQKQVQHCCLGVACEVVGAKIPYVKSDGPGYIQLGQSIRGISKVPKILIGEDDNKLVNKLAEMNDSGKSFEQIADWIEENL